jgi:NAD(P)-dependent dehydrogenase (short-subunit alcohol dehydrogenase family)
MSQRRYAITGAFGTLGAAVAKAAAAAGGRIALIDYAPAAPAGLVEGLGQGHVALAGVDLADAAAAKTAVDKAAEALGGLDVLINVAGGFRWETLEDSTADSWSGLFRINVLTASNTCRAAIPHLKASKSGRIVNIGAGGAVKAAMGMGPYAASKSGVHKLTEALAEELKGADITVNAVLPSIIDTPVNRADMPKSDFSTWVQPADLAAVILFLSSEEARAVTGALVPVSGRM